MEWERQGREGKERESGKEGEKKRKERRERELGPTFKIKVASLLNHKIKDG